MSRAPNGRFLNATLSRHNAPNKVLVFDECLYSKSLEVK
jgi:hypothetical protein